MRYYLPFCIALLLGIGSASCAQAQGFFAPSSSVTSSPQASAQQSSTHMSSEQTYQQWLQQYQQLQQQALQKRTIDPGQYNLPMPHQTGNQQQLQGVR